MCSVWQGPMQPGKAGKQFYKNPTFFSRGLTAGTLPTVKKLSKTRLGQNGEEKRTTTLKKKWGPGPHEKKSCRAGAGTTMAFLCLASTDLAQNSGQRRLQVGLPLSDSSSRVLGLCLRRASVVDPTFFSRWLANFFQPPP